MNTCSAPRCLTHRAAARRLALTVHAVQRLLERGELAGGAVVQDTRGREVVLPTVASVDAFDARRMAHTLP